MKKLLTRFLLTVLCLSSFSNAFGYWQITVTSSGHDSCSGAMTAPTSTDWPATFVDPTPNDSAIEFQRGAGGSNNPSGSNPGPTITASSAGSARATLVWIPANASDRIPDRIRIDVTYGAGGVCQNYTPQPGWSFAANTSTTAWASNASPVKSDGYTTASGTLQYDLYVRGRTSIELPELSLGATASIGGVTGQPDPLGTYSASAWCGITITVANSYFPGAVSWVQAVPQLAGISILTTTLPDAVAGVVYQAKIETKATGSIKVSWDPVPGAGGYVIDRIPGGSGFPKVISAGPTYLTEYVDNGTGAGLELGKTYTYTVAARNAAGDGPPSSPVTADAHASPDELSWIVEPVYVTGTWDFLPEGLDMMGQGAISFRPYFPGQVSLKITAFAGDPKASSPIKASRTLPINIATAEPLAMTSEAVPLAWAGENYSFQLQASGGVAPYRWLITSGMPPFGIVLNANGVLAGTPAEQPFGAERFEITVEDAAGAHVSRVFDSMIQLSRVADDDPLQEIAFQGPWTFLNLFEYTGGLTALPSDEDDPAFGMPLVGGQLSGYKTITAKVEVPTTRWGASGPEPIWQWTLDDINAGNGGLFPKSRFGNVAWFTHLGTPYAGPLGNEDRMALTAEVKLLRDRIVFASSKDAAFKAQRLARLRQVGYVDGVTLFDLEVVLASEFETLKGYYRRELNRRAALPVGHAERIELSAIEPRVAKFATNKSAQMAALYQWCAEKVEAYHTKFGQVQLHESWMSTREGDGTILICGDKALMKARGGSATVMGALEKLGLLKQADHTTSLTFKNNLAEEVGTLTASKAKVFEVTERGAKALRTVKGLKIGLVVVGLGLDIYDIVVAKDRVRAIVKAAGGWAGALATAEAAGAVAAAFGVDFAGPWGWGLHLLIVGGAGMYGYMKGSELAETVYDMVIQRVPRGQKIGPYIPRYAGQ